MAACKSSSKRSPQQYFFFRDGPTPHKWTKDELDWLASNYPQVGLAASAVALGRSVNAIRGKASDLGIKQNRDSGFFKDWQARAARSKVGKRRPEQAAVILKSLREGKMKATEETRRKLSQRAKEWHRVNAHPRGALGMKHSSETIAILREKSTAAWGRMTDEQVQERSMKSMKTRDRNGTMMRNEPHGSWKAAWREIGGVRKYYRSRWEANYARYLEWLKENGAVAEWEHEPETFWFEGVKRGCVSYLPDFRVKFPCGRVEYHEVKGWMDDRSKTKIKRMAKYHPKVMLIVIDAKAYRKLQSQVKLIVKEWE